MKYIEHTGIIEVEASDPNLEALKKILKGAGYKQVPGSALMSGTFSPLQDFPDIREQRFNLMARCLNRKA